MGDPGPDTVYGWGIPDGVLAIDYTPTSVADTNGATAPGDTDDAPKPSAILLNPHPNPFNAVVTLSFNLTEEGSVSLTIADITGRTTARLIEERLAPGFYSFTWNGGNHASGVYIVSLKSGSSRSVRKILLVK